VEEWTKESTEKSKQNKGFIAATWSKWWSTPKALAIYGVLEDAYSKWRWYVFSPGSLKECETRIITATSFYSGSILGAILFEQTMDRKIDGLYNSFDIFS